MMDLLNEDEAPSWETKYDRSHEIHATRAHFIQQQHAMAAERAMPAAQAEIARRNRMSEELQRQMDNMREQRLQEQVRREKRAREAIASARFSAETVAKCGLKWLRDQDLVAEAEDLQAAVERLFMLLMRQDDTVKDVCPMLENWRTWDARSGLNLNDIYDVSNQKKAFCYAACVNGLLKEVSTREETTVAETLKQCVRDWGTVKLG